MTSTSGQHREILRHAYVIILTLVVAAVASFFSFYVREKSESRARERLERFHLRSIMLTGECSKSIADTRQELLGANRGGSLDSDRKIAAGLDAIDRPLEHLVELHRELQSDEFVETIERVQHRYHRVLHVVNDETWTTTSFTADLGALDLALFQLNRLHAIAAEHVLERVATRDRRGTRGVAVIAVVVLLAAGILVFRALHLLKINLREHQRTQDALLESERQMQHASKMQALGTLVGGVAHDFNNILTAILGYSEALNERLRTDDRARVMVGEIQKAGKRAAMLTRHLLAFSRQDSIETQGVDLNVMIRELEPMLRRLIREDIDLVVQCAPAPCPAEVDVAQFEQVMVNLAVNARDAMARGGTLTFRTSLLTVVKGDPQQPRMPGGRYVRLTVEDTGCGMDPAVRSRVFEPFFTTKDRDRGTGLGLSTVHGIVSKSQGFIFVESETGTGSRFDIYLPRYDEPAKPSRAEERLPDSTTGSETVLVAEDEKPVRDVLTAGLRAAGYRVLPARDGMEALRICADHDGPIDLILTDVVMPTIGGPEVVRRAKDLRPRARVVYVTGYADEAALGDMVGSDAPVVSKPFQLQELLSLIRRELDGPQAGRADSNAG